MYLNRKNIFICLSAILSFLAVQKGNSSESVKASISYLSANVLSSHAVAGDTVCYYFKLTNIHTANQEFALNIQKTNELACKVFLSDDNVSLKSGESLTGKLSLVMSDKIPVGGYESCILTLENSTGAVVDQLQFNATNSKPHPFLLTTPEVLEETKNKVKEFPWAKSNFENMLMELDNFEFPKQKVITKPRPTKVWSSLNYKASDGEKAFKLAIAYKLSDNKLYFKKLKAFVDKLSDPKDGYLSVGAATTGVMVHEGNFFLHLAAACDLVYDELGDKTKSNIEAIFRHYLKQNRKHMNSLGIMNHQASANAGAILVAIYLQDVAEVDFLTWSDGGMADQIGKGVMADGWWFESTVNYCYLVAQRYCLVAQAFENYGWDLYHKRFPTKYKSKDFENAKEGFTGMKFENWGPAGKSTRGVEDMVRPYIPFMDENAVVVSSNDSRATKPDPYYELAYRQYGGNDLAWVLRKTDRSSWIALLYGVPELPKVKDPRTKSAFAPNVGITALRSQQNNPIEAYVKYGTHGGWHGQFDRTGLLALNRNNHKYFGTEMCWFGYGHPGYKECVQTSATHNMVIVDELQQEAVPSEQILFYGGDKMQVSVTQTEARWRKIPTFNIEKFPPWNDKEFEPNFEPITQRRCVIVTNHYVVLADYMKSTQRHTYDWLIHPVGFENLMGAKRNGAVLDTVNTNFESPYKYFTKAQWYKAKNGVKASFNDDGNQLEVHTLWPKKSEVLVAKYPNGGKGDQIKNNKKRNTLAIRTKGTEMVYLTLIEPFKGASAISKIESRSEDQLTVHLTNGKTQTLFIENFTGEPSNINVKLEEQQGNSTIVEESNAPFVNPINHDKVFTDFKVKEFVFEGRVARIVYPKKANKKRNWIWRARFWGHEPQVDKALLEQGYHVVYVDVANLFGGPKAVELWNKFYNYCISELDLNAKVTLEGMSRGGLIIYNWAAANTNKVSCIYADAPVCDIKSWPGGLFKSDGSQAEWELCLKAHRVNKENVINYKGIPLFTGKKVAQAKIPVLHVYGDADKVVPFEENTALLKKVFEKEGAKMDLIKKEGVGHHPHCLKNPKSIVDFILQHR